MKSLEDKIEAQKANLNVEGVHTQHVGIAHTRSNSKIFDKFKMYMHYPEPIEKLIFFVFF